ncbi:hydrophobin [Diaporthe helianthi]|uniref:Hydrophobin n=1 Tax=Diaporthe helianthi TaxID=158607 RepID=A0A2P5IEM3_DIAHE|nr:hydrophobin [Diaporthe helianthi]
MHFITITLLALVASVLGLPPIPNPVWDGYTNSSDLGFELVGPCGAVARKAVCCKKSFYGIVDFHCHKPQGNIQTGADLELVCSAKAKRPRCCLMGGLGTYIACKPPKYFAEMENSDDAENGFEVVATGQYYDVEML